MIAANKLDLAVDSEAIQKLVDALPEKEILPISGVSKQNVPQLLETVWKMLYASDNDAP